MSLDLRFLLSASDHASGTIEKVGGSLDGLIGKAGQLGAPMAAAGAVITGAMGLSMNSAAAYGDEIAKASDKSGVLPEDLSRLRYAAEQSDVEFGKLTTSLARMQRNAYEASQGSGQQQEAFAALGVSVVDANGKLKDGNALFLQLAGSIARTENETERAALAQMVFGRGGVALLPMLKDGAEGVKQLGERAQDLGLIWDGPAAKAAERYNDSLNDVKLATRGLGQSLVTNLGPSISAVAENLAEGIGRFTEWSKEHETASKLIIGSVGAVGAAMGVGGPILMALPSLIGGLRLVQGWFRGTAAVAVESAAEIRAAGASIGAGGAAAGAGAAGAGAAVGAGAGGAAAGAAGAVGLTVGGAVAVGTGIGAMALAAGQTVQGNVRLKEYREELKKTTDEAERAKKELEGWEWLKSRPLAPTILRTFGKWEQIEEREQQARETIERARKMQDAAQVSFPDQRRRYDALLLQQQSPAGAARAQAAGDASQMRLDGKLQVEVTGSAEMMREMLRNPEGYRAFQEALRRHALSAGHGARVGAGR